MNIVIGNANIDASSRDEGFVVGAFRGSHGISASNLQERETKRFAEDFKKAFSDATKGQNKHIGLLLKYSYYDTQKSAWGGVVDTDRAPWDALSTASGAYSHFEDEEVRTINIGIREGILDQLPRDVHYVSFGPGESSVFKMKDGKLITGLVANGHMVHSGITIDINKRYSMENAQVLYDSFGCDATAIQGDFFTRDFFDDIGTRLTAQEGSTPVVAIFGGTAQNIAEVPGMPSGTGTRTFFSKMAKALPGAHIIMTVDATPKDVDPDIVTRPYQYSLENEIFVLNFMQRAKQQGIILDPQYEVLKNWRITDPVWTGNAVNGFIEAKKDHKLNTIVGEFDIKAGNRVSVSTSRKGPINDHIDQLSQAGFHDIVHFPQSRGETGTSKYIIHAIAPELSR